MAFITNGGNGGVCLFSQLVRLFFKRKKQMTVDKVTLSIFSEFDFSYKPFSLSNTVN